MSRGNGGEHSPLMLTLTVYVCPYCGTRNLDRWRNTACPHRGDHYEAIEVVPAEQLRGAVAALRVLTVAAKGVLSDAEGEPRKVLREAIRAVCTHYGEQ